MNTETESDGAESVVEPPKDKRQFNVLGRKIEVADGSIWTAREGYRLSDKLAGMRIPRLFIAKASSPRVWMMFINKGEAKELRGILDKWLGD